MGHTHKDHKVSFLQLATEALRSAGGRMTRPRLAVVECLANSTKPLSAQEIFERLNTGSGKLKVDRVSVYRILEALASKGLVHLVGASGKFLACFHSQCRAGQHIILLCSICSVAREVDLPSSLAKSLQTYLFKNHHFHSEGHGMFLEGQCQTCADKAKR